MFKLYNILTISLIAFSCNSQQEEISIEQALSKIPLQLEQLKVVENDTIIFHPCDAANRTISFEQRDKIWLIFMEEGHETTMDTVISFTKLDDNLLTLNISPFYSSSGNEYHIEIVNDQISKWKWANDYTEFKEVFVSKSKNNTFRLVEQPCRECWDDEVCDDFENE